MKGKKCSEPPKNLPHTNRVFLSALPKRAFFLRCPVSALTAFFLWLGVSPADGGAHAGMPVDSSALMSSLTGVRAPLFLRMICSIFLERRMGCAPSLPVGSALLTSANNLA